MSSNVLPFTPRTSPTDAPERSTPAPVTRAVYTIAEAAYLLSLSTGSTYALVRKGEIPAMKLGGRWVIPIGRFNQWLDSLPTASPELTSAELREMAAELEAERAAYAATRGKPAG